MTNETNDFDARAKEWDTPSKIDRSKTLAAAIAKQLPEDRPLNAMEFGCGTGLLSFELIDRFSGITLVDTSAGMLDVLREKIKIRGVAHFHPMLKDIIAEPMSEKYDVIFTAMTLHHIPDAGLALRAFADLITPGGLLFIADLDKEDGSFHVGSEKVHHGFDRKELLAMTQQAGFTEIQFITAHTMIKQKNLFFNKKYPIFLMRAKRA